MPTASGGAVPGAHGPATLAEHRAQVLGEVVALHEQWLRAEVAVRSAISEAREGGVSWEAIGGALGVSRQAANQRWQAR